jgi:hypothetical protein
VERSEIDRLRAQEDHPETLRGRVRVVGTAEGAALMEIPVGRFSRLARLGLLVPVKWYLNRYRAVVWLYLAEDLREFVSDPGNAHLLRGRTPENLRGQLETGLDLRARNWRGRHLGFLLRQAEDPWVRAGAVAAFLSPVEIADVVKDPYERAYLHRSRPAPPGQGAPGSPAAPVVEKITTAQDPDEIEWLRSDLAQLLQEARALTPAPRPGPRRAAAPVRRAVARPIPPMVPTVTRPGAPAAPASAAPGDNPSAARAPEPLPDRRRPAGEPVSRALAWHGAPVMRAAAPPARPHPDDRRAGRASSRPTRGLRAWLRRRSPRPARL